jgi:hypothetical protein
MEDAPLNENRTESLRVSLQGPGNFEATWWTNLKRGTFWPPGLRLIRGIYDR